MSLDSSLLLARGDLEIYYAFIVLLTVIDSVYMLRQSLSLSLSVDT